MIDLRSDTITRPSPGMRRAMAEAEVGDDVFGEDPTVNRLERRTAELLGKEAALFVPSGTMANQLCIKAHTRPGDEVIAEAGAHVFFYETAGAAFLSSVQIYPVAGTYGALSPEDVRAAIRPDIYYMPKTRLLSLENTHNRAGGTVYPMDLFRQVTAFASSQGLAVHLDGARLWNASVASGITLAAYASCVDSVSVCFSKGLGAPVGSAVVGSRDFIEEVRHYRKIFGGGMRQAGILAAAALYALDNNIGRLAEDHEKAAAFARHVADVPGLTIDLTTVQTNMAVLDVAKTGASAAEWGARFQERGVRLIPTGPARLRAVTHLDVSMKEVVEAARVIGSVIAGG